MGMTEFKAQEERLMIKLHAKRDLISGLGLSIIVADIYIWIGIYGGERMYIVGLIYGVPAILISILSSVKMYLTHYIEYGNGKIIIKQDYKEVVDKKPVGKWKSRESEIMVESIVRYGNSWEVLGRRIEFTHSCGNVYLQKVEYFLELSSDEIIGFDAAFYTKKQLGGLFQYIYNETGIECSHE